MNARFRGAQQVLGAAGHQGANWRRVNAAKANQLGRLRLGHAPPGQLEVALAGTSDQHHGRVTWVAECDRVDVDARLSRHFDLLQACPFRRADYVNQAFSRG